MNTSENCLCKLFLLGWVVFRVGFLPLISRTHHTKLAHVQGKVWASTARSLLRCNHNG